METMRMKIINSSEQTLAVSHSSGDGIAIVYAAEYQQGDRVVMDVDGSGYFFIRLDEAMPEALCCLDGDTFSFPVPWGGERVCYSPKAFYGSCHLLTARRATAGELSRRRNLAFNPYDRHTTSGLFPHATANVETRNEAVFAARNAIDGIFENGSHGVYPYSSWGVNKDPNAQLRLDFGRAVILDSVRITLRADFPHDNWWKSVTITFSDGSSIAPELKKSPLPQQVDFEPKTVEWLTLGQLLKSDEPSPFPALTQLEAMGIEAGLA